MEDRARAYELAQQALANLQRNQPEALLPAHLAGMTAARQAPPGPPAVRVPGFPAALPGATAAAAAAQPLSAAHLARLARLARLAALQQAAAAARQPPPPAHRAVPATLPAAVARAAPPAAAALAAQPLAGTAAYTAYQQALEQRRQQQKERKAERDAARQEAARLQAVAAASGLGLEEARAADAELEDVSGDEGDDEAEAGHTYSDYKALQIRELYPAIMGHPDPLVETASLASIPLPKPNFHPESLEPCIQRQLLSDAQLEAVVYANMKWRGAHLKDGSRAGFFLGDGAGVGKGRQIAAMIKQFWHEGGRRVLWVSVSNDLRKDAERDLSDIEAGHIGCFPRAGDALPTARKDLPFKGVLFVTYSMLVSGLRAGGGGGKRGKDKEAQTQAQGKDKKLERLEVPPDSRLGQFLRWLEKEEDGPLLIFDECHKAKNMLPSGGGKPSQTARAVVEIQERLPMAKILYSSATGASEPRNLAYMTRLGMWGFTEMQETIEMLSKSKLGALELAAMSMKATGSYISRALSYEGAEFSMVRVEIDPKFKVMYERACSFWQLLWKVVDVVVDGRKRSLFWGAHQRFFKQMLMAAKVKTLSRLALDELGKGNCVVIGLQSTGEANTNALLQQGEDFDDLVSAPKMILSEYLRKHFPVTLAKDSIAELSTLECEVWDAVEAWRQMTPAAQVAAGGVAGMAAERAADLVRMGAAVTGMERLEEEDLLARRLAMRAEQERMDREAAEERRKERCEAWVRNKAAREEELRQDLLDAEEDVEAAEAKLQSLNEQIQALSQTAPPKPAAAAAAAAHPRRLVKGPAGGAAAAAAAGVASMEDSSDDKGENMTLGQLASQRRSSKKRPLQLLDSDDEEGSGDEAPAAAKRAAASAPRPMKLTQVLVDSDSDEETAAGGRLPASPVLGPKDLNAQGAGPLGAARKPAERHAPVLHINLTDETDSDLVCLLCGTEGDPEELLLCDGCDRACHGSCMGLQRLPLSWFCSCCSGKSGTAQQSRAPAARVNLVSSDSSEEEQEEEVLSPITAKAKPGPTARASASPPSVPAALKAQHTRARTRLTAAKHRLKTAQQALEQLQEELAQGPQDERAARGRLRGGPAAGRGGSSTHDPTVRNLTVKDTELEGYRHTVHCTALDGLERYQDPLGEAAAAQRGQRSGKGKGGKGAESDEGLSIGEEDQDDYIPDFHDDGDLLDDPDAERPARELLRIRVWLERLVGALELPPNPLDQLVDLLGGEERVAELTGRKGSVSMDGENRASYKLRVNAEGPLRDINLREKEAFMEGRKLVAIISDAASTGISLQADRRVANQRRRVHFTLELPWSADKAIQQFGRSHRANQVTAPLYRILVSPCGGEYRFASAAAKRLQSLGALLKGDRNATGAGAELKAFDIDNPTGERALQRVLADITSEQMPMPGVKVPKVPDHLVTPEMLAGYQCTKDHYHPQGVPNFFKYMRFSLMAVGLLAESQQGGVRYVEPQKKTKIKCFLNRLLGLGMGCQELLFDYFCDTLDKTIAQLKSEGKVETGIVTVKGNSCSISSRRVIHRDDKQGGEVEAVSLMVDRGLTWDAAISFRDEVMTRLEENEPRRRHYSGFYIMRNRTTLAGGQRRSTVILATEVIKSASNLRNVRMHIQRPNIGPCGYMTFNELCEKDYVRIEEAKAKELWDFWFEYHQDHCCHGDLCSVRRRGGACDLGVRQSALTLLTGAVLPIWLRLEELHRTSAFGRFVKTAEGGAKKQSLRVVKCITSEGDPVVGVELPGGEEEVVHMQSNLDRKPPQVQPGAAAAAAAGAFGHDAYFPNGRKRGRGHKRGAAGWGPTGGAGGSSSSTAFAAPIYPYSQGNKKARGPKFFR